MTFETFRATELRGWDERAHSYGKSTGLATTQAIPALLAAARVAMGRRVLDLCSGPGYAAGASSALGGEATGVDFAPKMVSAAQIAFPSCRFVEGDAARPPVADSAFDAVVCNFGLLHLTVPEEAMAAAWRALVPGGRAAFTHWCGPDASPLFKVVFGALGAHADMSAAPPAPPPFALSDPAALAAAMTGAGFVEVTVSDIPIVLETPAAEFVEFWEAFSVRAGMIFRAQSGAVRQAIAAVWQKGLAPFVEGGTLRVPMPARLAAGVKPRG